jgi:1A family penicillin-binding protein
MKITDSVWRLWYRFRNARLRKQLLLLAIAWVVFLVGTPVITYAYFVRDIQNPERLMNRNSTGIVILDRHGETIYSSGKVSSTKHVKLSDIDDDLEHAVIASEDQGFYSHPGFSPKGILAAIYANVANKDLKRYGGSTITQQLVKNNLLSSHKSFLRKYQELSIAIAVDKHYSKEEILEMYLNSVYFGEGAFGIEEASQVYFGKPAKDLTIAESAMLTAILPAPSTTSPLTGDREEAVRQQHNVLQKMYEADQITQEERTAAEGEVLTYTITTPEVQDHAQHYTQMVLEELTKRYGEERIKRSGFVITTGLDLGWQKEAEQNVRQQIERTKDQGATNGALVAIDPHNGEIRALVGSSAWLDPDHGQVNMVLTPRQPGSSFKPIYYTEALAKRLITPATILKDEPKDFNGYKPHNYDFRYRGDITVRRALATSLNIPAIEVMQKVGIAEAVATANRMGISDVNEPDKYGLTLALGTAETKLLDMTNAYAAFANQGEQFQPTLIVNIKDKFQRTIYTNKPVGKFVQTKESTYLISSILSDNAARAPTFGSSLNISGRQVAVKTGTTDDNVDAWTLGYTPSIVAGVWVGDNAHKPMTFGGSVGAGPIWRNSMQTFLKDSPVEQFKQPTAIEKVTVCNATGTYQEFFIRGTAPNTRCESRIKTPTLPSRQTEPTTNQDSSQTTNARTLADAATTRTKSNARTLADAATTRTKSNALSFIADIKFTDSILSSTYSLICRSGVELKRRSLWSIILELVSTPHILSDCWQLPVEQWCV